MDTHLVHWERLVHWEGWILTLCIGRGGYTHCALGEEDWEGWIHTLCIGLGGTLCIGRGWTHVVH